MTNTLIFIRHAKTQIDKNKPIEKWVLTEEGKKDAEELTKTSVLQRADVLISSDEDKAYLTIKPLADRLNKNVARIPEFGEIKRPNAEKLSTEQYEDMKKKVFEDLNYSEYGWETANHALKRFRKAAEDINKIYKNKRIIVCSHGTVMSLYFAYLQNKLKDVASRWKNLEFGSYGIVEENLVVKDIVRN